VPFCWHELQLRTGTTGSLSLARACSPCPPPKKVPFRWHELQVRTATGTTGDVGTPRLYSKRQKVFTFIANVNLGVSSN
jgi:hypothetical protein